MTTWQIIHDWLKEHGYDGLYCDDAGGEECGCELADLFPCGQIPESCVAGYKHSNGKMYPKKEGGKMSLNERISEQLENLADNLDKVKEWLEEVERIKRDREC